MINRTGPLHICHFVDNLADAEQNRQVFNVIGQFSSDAYEHTLVVLKKQPGLNVRFPPNTSCIELNPKGVLNFGGLKECRRVIALLRPDICHTYGDNTMAIQWFAYQHATPLRLHTQFTSPSTSAGLAHLIEQWRYRLLSPPTHFIVTTSDESEQWLLQHTQVEENKVKLIRFGIDSQRLCPPLRHLEVNTKEHMIGTAPVPSDKFVIGTSICDAEPQDVEHFFEAYAKARQRDDDFADQAMLLVSGNSPHLPAYRQCIDRLALPENAIRFCGLLTDRYQFNMHVDCYASLHRKYVFPSKTLEAMSMGLPILLANQDAYPQYQGTTRPVLSSSATQGKYTHDRLLQLFTNVAQRMQLGRLARLHIQQHHDEKIHQQRCEALYVLAYGDQLGKEARRYNQERLSIKSNRDA
ncbi:glycosyltransferase family 4 protein [Enterovibrio norvegicus]|uniref:glycosyltransferase family 4 protein n=1 Tax=Enterovibrio norvegicus TaxID=188144 RepID=UPI00031D1931|nr:glycosyltransferase family 4 protein [Enterovibrio norvegicus]OEE61326.1 hypothetical protein A1OS_19455 [Enterovibrio norvegicus]PMI32468.1 hypothetical protein BCU47_02305 [Enterovibrio norvegicus]TKF11437.1 glycosyltransferase family 4 protein [Enterovibrio norvegicus]